MKLMFFPVTTIEDLPHILLNFNFSRKKDRYFLSPYDVEVSSDGSQKTVCQIIRSSDFLCALLNIDRATVLKESGSIPSTNSTTEYGSTTPISQTNRRALSCSSTSAINNSNDFLLTMIEQKLDFKHRCMFYSAGPTSDLCVCALDVDHNPSVLCNAFGYSNLLKFNDETTNHQIRYQQRHFIHQWICIRDILDGLITCNHILKGKIIQDILIKVNLWIKQRYESRPVNLKTIQFDLLGEQMQNKKFLKAQARQLIWDLMEIKNEVRHPRPSHGRIPNFRYCEVAAENLVALECFKRARVVKINPSMAQEPVRYLTLTHNKVLLTPTPSLDSALFYKLDPKFLRRNQLEWAATKSGAAELGTVMQLQALKQIHIDLVIVASVVVNPITGARIGRGKGFTDLEYAIMSQMGCVSNKTIVMTTCHESQLINDLPNHLMEEHDLPVDIIVTPKRYIYTKRTFSRPTRINWSIFNPEMMINIPVLQELKRLEDQHLMRSQ